VAFGLRAWNLSYNTAFLDETLHIRDGGQLLSGTPASHFMGKAGYVWVFPVLATLADARGGLEAVRFMNVLFGTSAVFCVFLFARVLYSPRVGCLAALLYAISAPLIFVSRFGTQDAMSNALLAFTLFLLTRGVKDSNRGTLLLGASVGFLSFLAKYPGGFYFPFIFLALSFHKKRGLIWKYFALPLTLLVAAYLGYYFSDLVSQFLLGQVADKHAKYEAVNLKILQESVAYLGPATLLALVGLVGQYRHRLTTIALISGGLVILLYHFGNQDPEAFYKHVAYGLIFLAPAAGLGLDSIPGSRSRVVSAKFNWVFVVSAVFVLMLLLSRQQMQGVQTFWPNSGRAVTYLEEHLQGEKLLLAENGAIYNYYLRLHGPRFANLTIWDTFTTYSYADATGEQALFEALEDSHFDYVILDGTSTPQLDQEIVARFGSRYRLAFTDLVDTSLGEVTISVFERTGGEE